MYSLYFTNYFLDPDIPDYVRSKLKPEKLGLLEQRFFYSILNDSRNAKLSYFIYLNMIKGNINKLIFIFRTLFPPAAVLILAKYQYQIAFVADQEINMLACLTEIMVECEFK